MTHLYDPVRWIKSDPMPRMGSQHLYSSSSSSSSPPSPPPTAFIEPFQHTMWRRAIPPIKLLGPHESSFREPDIFLVVTATLFAEVLWVWMEKRWVEREKNNQKKIAAFKAKLKEVEEAKAKKEKEKEQK
ncbi:hypothetical protein L13192_02863 [Pyrenophora tritici-repentis]|nr:hypothetical protein L13192_02863 [Pyrenophora tritici-repentis]KAI1686000.1 hypothetical protein KJE20_03965 [Pyrenophora tritici-repentis]